MPENQQQLEGEQQKTAAVTAEVDIVDEEVAYQVCVGRPSKSSYAYPDNYIRSTKYTIWTFLPVNLFNQFRRFHNLYFLLAAVFAFIPNASSIDPTTQVFPLVVILIVTMLKDGIEDYYRYQSDKKANNSDVVLIKNSAPHEALSQVITAGDIVYVRKGERIPADLILLSTSFTDGTCFIETSQLDGETNLKRRCAVQETWPLASPEKIGSINGCIECEMPNNRLNSFDGRFLYREESTGKDKTIPLSVQNFVPRGSELRNTEFIFGLCIYAGVDAKIIRNQAKGNLKYSTMDGKLNKYLIAVFIYNAVLLVAGIVFGGQWATTYIYPNVAWYLWESESTNATTTANTQAMTWFIVLTYLIPISLFISLEMVRLVQAYFIIVDEDMIKNNPAGVPKPAIVKNSNLNEDLGVIEFVFSDKTGTLTQNVMRLSKWYVVGGLIFDEDVKQTGMRDAIRPDSKVDADKQKTIEKFLRHITLCHTAIPAFNEKTKTYTYEAESPDESALLNSAKANSIVVTNREKSKVTIDFDGKEEAYELLDIIEFNSDRKRMSCILKFEGEIVLFCKGADSIIFDRIDNVSQAAAKREMDKALTEFSNLGLRTLVFAFRVLSQEEYDGFKVRYTEASASLQNREKKIMDVAEGIEKNMILLGASAIEDKLQENVPETIDYLLRCGIKVWVLTGDKTETAIKIALSCKLFKPEMTVMRMEARTRDETERVMNKILEGIKERGSEHNNALVVNGDCLRFALEHFESLFLEIATRCHSVLCCRVSPMQKALVVKVVKNTLKKVTLSIGDGANDVPMILAASVGVGIAGLEGAQAVRASDYSFTQFQCLKKLLVVHGRYSNFRLSQMISYSMFKNIGFITVCFWFALHNGWTGSQIYQEDWLTFYNVIFASLPPLGMGALEKDVTEDLIEKNPAVYGTTKRRSFVDTLSIIKYNVMPLYHSVIMYFGLYLLMGEGALHPSGYTVGFWIQAWIISSAVTINIMLKVVILQKHWTWLMFHTVSLEVLLYLLFMFVAYPVGRTTDYRAAEDSSSLATTYLYLLLMAVTTMLPDFIMEYVIAQFFPTDEVILREEAHEIRYKPKKDQ